MGKARSFSDAANDTVYQTGINSENYSMGQQNTYNLGSVHFTDQSGIGNFSQAGSDQRKASLQGALFLGNLGFDLQTVLLDTGTETIDLNNDSTGTVLSVISTDRFVTLDSGTTGTLTTITGAQRPGQRLRLYNTTINTITITHTAAVTVNTIRTPDGTDLTFPGNGVLDLTFDITSAQWRVVGNVGSGGGTNLLPLDNVWTGNNSWTGQTFDVNTTTSATITSPLFTVESALTTIGDNATDILNLIAHVGSSIIPTVTDTFQIGSSSLQWNEIFIKEINATTETTITSPLLTIESALTTFGNATSDIFNFVGRVGSSILPTLDASFDLGSSSLQWNEIFVTTINATTETTVTSPLFTVESALFTIGDSATDILNVIGKVGSSLIPNLDASFDLGTALLEWDNLFVATIDAFTETTIASGILSIDSPIINLGDASSDNVNFLGQIATQMVIEEITVPGTPPANTVTLYAKDDAGTSSLFFKDDSGAEFNLNATGGAGANTALSNLASVAINTSLLPDADGTLNLGSAAFSWFDTFTERLRIETGGASTSTANQIISDTGGMVFNTPAGDRYEFNISGSPNGIAIEEDRIQFLTSGRQHRIDAGATSITIVSESTNDSILLFPGSSRSNEAINCQNLQTRFLNNTTASRYELLLVYTNATTTGQPAIGNIGFMADSSLNVESAYAGIVTAIEDDTSAGRDGRMQIVVANNDGAGAAGVGQITGVGMDVQSDAGVMKLGFFGATPVAQQSPAATAAAIITALENLGLFV